MTIKGLILRNVAALAVFVPMAFGTAQAGFSNSASGLASPGSTVTFLEIALADYTLMTTQYASEGVTFSTASGGSPTLFFDTNDYGGGSYPSMSGNVVHSLDLPESPPSIPLLISFAGPITEAAFAMYTKTGSGVNTFEALLDGDVVATGTHASDATETDNYYMFTGITLDAIRITIDPTTNGFFIIDNIQLGAEAFTGGQPVPEPASAVLWSVLGAVGLVARRRRRQPLA